MEGASPDKPDSLVVSPGRLRPLLGVAVSAVALTGVVWWALRQPAPEFPTSARSLTLIGIAVGVICCSILLRGLRWSVILRGAGIRTRPAEPYALTAVGYMGNTVLPLRGGEVLRVVLLRENSNAGWAGSVGSIIPERVLDVISLTVVFAALVLAGVIETPGGQSVAVAALVTVSLVLAAAYTYWRLRRARYLERFAERIRPFARASRLLFTPSGTALGAMSIGIWIVDGTIFWLVAEALSLPIGLPEGVGLAVVAALFSTIPAGPAYAGTYDAALLFSLRALDVVGSAAVTYVLIVRFVVFVPVTLAGLVLTIARYGGLAQLRRRAAEEAAPEAAPHSPQAAEPQAPAAAGSERRLGGPMRESGR